MRPFPFLASSAALCVVLLPLTIPSCGGSTSTPPTTETGSGGGASGTTGSGAGSTTTATGTGGAGTMTMPTDTCTMDGDCTWGEIPNEILQSTDCICLYGCPFLPQTKVTAARRSAQNMALCNPRMDGMGRPCGIDDCAGPGAIACIDGACKAAPRDSGVAQ